MPLFTPVRAALALCCLSIAASPMPLHAAPPVADDARGRAVAALLDRWNSPGAPGVAVSVSRDGVAAGSWSVGLADIERSMPIGPDSVFQAASVSKQFTAFAILLLEADGRLSIDDPVARHIPEAARFGPITLRQLLMHRGGLREIGTLLAAAGWREEDLTTRQQALDMIFAQRGVNFAPGTRYEYSNTGYTLLAEVVRRVSGRSFADFCAERIFAPLGMRHSRFQEDLAEIVPGRAESYAVRGNVYEHEVLSWAVSGSTGLLTTAEDLGRWARNFETGAVGGTALLKRMEERLPLSGSAPHFYAFGQEAHVYRGFATWSHGGRDQGFRSFLLRVPGARLSVAILSNRKDMDAAGLAYAVADIYLRDRPGYRPDPVVRTRPRATDLAAYAGDYEYYPGIVFSLRSDGRQLRFSSFGEDKQTVLRPLSSNAFMLDERAQVSLVFDPPVQGQSPGFGYTIGLNGVIAVRRVDLQPLPAGAAAPEVFAGRYASRELGTDYVLAVEGGVLVLRHPRFPAIRLRPYQKDSFLTADMIAGRLDFERDAAGAIRGFRLSVPLATDIAFAKNMRE